MRKLIMIMTHVLNENQWLGHGQIAQPVAQNWYNK